MQHPVLAYRNFELQFIVTTDAFQQAVAVVLSQVQHAMERPLAYDSRQVNQAERVYSASEMELLASVGHQIRPLLQLRRNICN